jgi:predicted dithiol-disulfide oxidoreductase (DUF899 family)
MYSTGPRANRRWPIYSKAVVNSLSITSCSGPMTRQDAHTAPLRADGFNGINVHLKHHDVTMICVSRAPYEKLAAYKKRMGWSFPWVSSDGTEFNFDYHVSFTPEETAKKKAFFNYAMQDPWHDEREGHSVFYKDEGGNVFHTYRLTRAATKSSTSTITTWI